MSEESIFEHGEIFSLRDSISDYTDLVTFTVQ